MRYSSLPVRQIQKIMVTLLSATVIIICLGQASIFAGEPAAEELFREIPYSSQLESMQEQKIKDPTVIRSRYVQVNFDYLASSQLHQGADTIVLNLFPDVYLLAVKDRLERESATSYTWFGRIEGVEQSQVTTVVVDGNMASNITVREKIYQVRSVADGIHTVREINQGAFPEGAPPIPVETPYLDKNDIELDFIPELQADDGSLIDVLVVYTTDAAAASGNIASEIQLAIAETNTSYANSGITQRLRLVHSGQVTYTESGDFSIDLPRLRDPTDGYMDNVHTLRNTYSADVVTMLIENAPGFCGRGYRMDTAGSWFESWAFSVVKRDCATGNYSFGHELGHNMGAGHDRYVVDNTDEFIFSYSYGYVNITDRWRTIMAYNTECSDSDFKCSRLQYWSNPDVSYGGAPMGVAEGQPDAADNRKTLNNTALTVANFRVSSGPGFSTNDPWIRAVINTVEKGPIEAVWHKGGEATTSRGDRVIWGHFYASPSDVSWGSLNNPDLFVKIWFDAGGRIDVNYFHVSVPDIEVFTDYPYNGTANEHGTTTMSTRYIRHYFEGGMSYSEDNYEDGIPVAGYSQANNPSGYSTINNLRIGSIIKTVEKGPINGVWQLGGQDTTTRGDQVVWGHFYASPSDVTWGSLNNPDLFVKIWFDAGGRIDVNYFHVSVPDIEVYSDYPDNSSYDQKGTTIMSDRYIRHEYQR
jgi:hypothetical protein